MGTVRLGTVAVDNSILRTVARCSTEAVVRYVLGFTARSEAAPLMAGRAAHEALAMWLQSKGDDAQGLQAFSAAYRGWSGTHVPTGDRLAYENTYQILKAWFRGHPFRSLPYTVSAIEQRVAVSIEPGVQFVGNLDAIGQSLSDGAFRVIEHKTTGALTGWWKARWHVDSQVTGYLWVAEQRYRTPFTGAYINAIEFGKLPSDASRTCKTHGLKYAECGALHAKGEVVSVTRTPGQVQAWKANALRLARRFRKMCEQTAEQLGGDSHEDWSAVQRVIQRLPQEGTFTASCQFCEFKEFCETGRTAKALVVHQPWDLTT